MHRSRPTDSHIVRNELARFTMVLGGILLFVFGFVVTIATLQGNHAAASSNDASMEQDDRDSSAPHNIYMLSGVLLSLAGVVLATVGPISAMFRGKG